MPQGQAFQPRAVVPRHPHVGVQIDNVAHALLSLHSG